MSAAAAVRWLKPNRTEWALAAGSCAALAVLTVALASQDKTKIVVAALGTLLGLCVAAISGNPRLCCLWGLMLTMTLSLSKMIGPYIPKLGGETAFRIELSDPFWLGLLFFQLRDHMRGETRGIRVPKVTYIWLVIVLMGFGEFFWGTWGMTAAHEATRMVKVGLLFLVVCNELRRPGRFLHCGAALMSAVIVQSIFGLVQFIFHARFGLTSLGEPPIETINELMGTSEAVERIYRSGGLMIHPNIFGIFLAASIPIAIALILVKESRGFRTIFLLAIVLGVPALIATFSRSSWASFVASFTALTLLIVLHARMRRRARGPAFLAVIGLGIFLAIYAGPIMRRLLESRGGATAARAEFAAEARNMIDARPWFGWGLNSYALAVPPFTRYRAWGAAVNYARWVPVVHNSYLLWWAETGLVGLSLHLLVIFSIIWTGLGNLRVRNDLLYAMNIACIAAMAAFLVDGLNSPSLRNNPCMRVFWVLCGIVHAVRYWRLHEVSGLPAAQPDLPQVPR